VYRTTCGFQLNGFNTTTIFFNSNESGNFVVLVQSEMIFDTDAESHAM